MTRRSNYEYRVNIKPSKDKRETRGNKWVKWNDNIWQVDKAGDNEWRETARDSSNMKQQMATGDQQHGTTRDSKRQQEITGDNWRQQQHETTKTARGNMRQHESNKSQDHNVWLSGQTNLFIFNFIHLFSSFQFFWKFYKIYKTSKYSQKNVLKSNM